MPPSPHRVKKLGMDFDKSLFGLHLSDAMSLSKLFAETKSLKRVCLAENLLNDESVHILTSGLSQNKSITSLGAYRCSLCFFLAVDWLTTSVAHRPVPQQDRRSRG